MMYALSQIGYLVASALFILALHWMNTPATARRGVYAGVAGMAIAILVTWADPDVVHHVWIIVAIVGGLRRRRAALARAADGRAAADGAVARVWRAGGRSRRHRRSTTCGLAKARAI